MNKDTEKMIKFFGGDFNLQVTAYQLTCSCFSYSCIRNAGDSIELWWRLERDDIDLTAGNTLRQVFFLFSIAIFVCSN